MKQLTVLFLIVPHCLAASCNYYTTCTDCNNVIDSDGSQSCSWCSKTRTCVAKIGLECAFGKKITDAYDCPLPIANGYNYEENFARNLMLPLSSAAYSSHPQTCLTNAINGAKLKKQVTVLCDSSEEEMCSGFVAISEYHKAIILSFRGTSGFIQLVEEATQSVFASKVSAPGGGKVSKYFYNAFETVWKNGLGKELISLCRSRPNYQLWITGHSLGGAMASIAANFIAASKIHPENQIKLVTFGQPRTGDYDFAKGQDKLLKYSYRLTHKADLVPHLPTNGYADYHHHRYEVWYDNDMDVGSEYTVCLSPEDDNCSNSNLVDFSVDDHTHYFGVRISVYGINGCVS